MDKIIKQVIEEKFASKQQQKYFYAKANDESLSDDERAFWKKRAKEFSKDTDFDKLPEKVNIDKEDLEEIIDDEGNIQRGTKEIGADKKRITSKSHTDKVVNTAHRQQGHYALHGTFGSRQMYYGESDLSKLLGYKDTLANAEDVEDAEDHFKNNLHLDDAEAEDKMDQMGYDENLPEDKVRLIENTNEILITKKEILDGIVQAKEKKKEIELLNKIKELKDFITQLKKK